SSTEKSSHPSWRSSVSPGERQAIPPLETSVRSSTLRSRKASARTIDRGTRRRTRSLPFNETPYIAGQPSPRVPAHQTSSPSGDQASPQSPLHPRDKTFRIPERSSTT